MAAAKKKSNSNISAENRFFEIVNWKKAQPRMRGSGNDWLKLYTSLLEHDGFGGMDDSARMLIVALWLYAARSGLHIFPNDPEWLARKIPMLNSKPDLGPLLNAADCYGNPMPFIRYCPSPKNKKASSTRSKLKRGRTAGTGIATRTRARAGESRVEESRVEEREERREETKPLRVSEEKKRERKERISTTEMQKKAEARQTETLEPDNPMESEAGSVKAKQHILPKPTQSVSRIRRSEPQIIGNVIKDWLPDHWQDPDAESFGWEIVRALGFSDNQYDLRIRSEWGAFAAWWSKVKKSAPALMLDELRAKAINKANYLRTKDKSAKNCGAVWFYIMHGELSQRGVKMTLTKAHLTRASPSQGEDEGMIARGKVM